MNLRTKYREWSDEGNNIKNTLFEIKTRNMSIEDLQEYKDCLKRSNGYCRKTLFSVIIFTMIAGTAGVTIGTLLGMNMRAEMGYLLGWILSLMVLLSTFNDRNIQKVSELIEKRLMEGRE